MNFQTLDLNLLRVFDAVMVERSLTRAAKVLHLSQPAVSHALSRLRSALGDELVTRTTTGVAPTARAEALWPTVRESLAQLRFAISPLGFDPKTDSTSFRLSMGDFMASSLLPGLVKAFAREEAAARLQVLPLPRRDPRQMLQQAEIDVVIGHFPEAVAAIAADGDGGQLRRERLYESDYSCVMRRDHPLTGGELTLDGFCAAQHLHISPSGLPQGPVDHVLAALGRRRDVVLTVNQFFTAGRIVAQSDLLMVMPMSFVSATGYAEAFAVRPLPLPASTVYIDMLWHARHDTSPPHRWLREHLRNACRSSFPEVVPMHRLHGALEFVADH